MTHILADTYSKPFVQRKGRTNTQDRQDRTLATTHLAKSEEKTTNEQIIKAHSKTSEITDTDQEDRDPDHCT